MVVKAKGIVKPNDDGHGTKIITDSSVISLPLSRSQRKSGTYLAQETRSKTDVWAFGRLHSFSTFRAKNAKIPK